MGKFKVEIFIHFPPGITPKSELFDFGLSLANGEPKFNPSPNLLPIPGNSWIE
jgi:hypothetical protein